VLTANAIFFQIPVLRINGTVTVQSANNGARLFGNVRDWPPILTIRPTSGTAGKAGGNVTPTIGKNTGNDIPGSGNAIGFYSASGI
jgi:hypothetical protein